MRGHRKKRSLKLRYLLVGILLLGIALFIPRVAAQGLRPEFVAQRVYEKVPNFPKANEYRRRDSNEVDPNNTLLSRLIRYHQDIKKRPTGFRFDWQLTMADYLGINEPIPEERYPSANILTTNPLETDRLLIIQLTPPERSEVIDALTSVYNPLPPSQPRATPPTPTPSPVTPTPPRQPLPSQPGAADLLKL
jgi:hypothetical protein